MTATERVVNSAHTVLMKGKCREHSVWGIRGRLVLLRGRSPGLLQAPAQLLWSAVWLSEIC